ncbi:hypothetical protein PED39_03370 [Methanomassiliicoccales archaeon LGM-RCC1]|nr:hypothetical protein PED39_03370 [Methanomassiliicoccales archaeon LGM-RCC1]
MNPDEDEQSNGSDPNITEVIKGEKRPNKKKAFSDDSFQKG